MAKSAKNKRRIKKANDRLKLLVILFYTIEVFFILGLLLPRYDGYDIALYSSIVSITVGFIYLALKYLIPLFYADSPPSNIQPQQITSTNIPIGRSNFLKVGILISICLIIVLIAIGLFRSIKEGKSSEIDNTVAEINSVTTLLKVRSFTQDLFIEDDANSLFHQNKHIYNFSQVIGKAKPSSQLVITLVDFPNEPAYLFDEKKYIKETGGSFSKISTSNICQFIEQEIEQKSEEKVPILEAIKKLPLDIEFGRRGVSIKTSASLFIVELIYIIRKAIIIANTRVEILVKGFADGQSQPWSEKLIPGKYEYHYIDVYEAHDKYSKNPIQYMRRIKRRSITFDYYNRDLPNLRSRFVIDDFITPFISSCAKSKQIETAILDGYELPQIEPQQRKVEIYILIY